MAGKKVMASKRSRKKAAQRGGIKVVQDRPPNFRDKGKLYLVRCFKCDPQWGKENWMMSVASGECAWCGWKE